MMRPLRLGDRQHAAMARPLWVADTPNDRDGASASLGESPAAPLCDRVPLHIASGLPWCVCVPLRIAIGLPRCGPCRSANCQRPATVRAASLCELPAARHDAGRVALRVASGLPWCGRVPLRIAGGLPWVRTRPSANCQRPALVRPSALAPSAAPSACGAPDCFIESIR